MGINLKDIVDAVTVDRRLPDFKGKTIAVDAANTLYQFLSVIRQPDGTPLKDQEGRVTSHLNGLFYRNMNLLQHDIRPVYVFDGKPHQLKAQTLQERAERKKQAQADYEAAVEAGDLAVARTKAMQTTHLTREMIAQAKELLTRMGLPYVSITGTGEGEALAAKFCADGKVDYCGTQDYDALLFGTKALVRNINVVGRRRLPGSNRFITVYPQTMELERVLTELDLNREELIKLAILVGTDFNPGGVKRVGPKTALKLLKKHDSDLDAILAAKETEIPAADEIMDIFLNPTWDGHEGELTWSKVDGGAVKDYLGGEFGFSRQRIDEALEKHRKAVKKSAQTDLSKWF